MLVVENVSHGFGARTILENVSFRLKKGEHIALVGANGEGKSSFLNIITKKLMPDAGNIKWSSRATVGYLDQHAVLEKGMTIRDVLRDAFKNMFELEQEMLKMYDLMGEADEEQMNKLLEETAEIQTILVPIVKYHLHKVLMPRKYISLFKSMYKTDRPRNQYVIRGENPLQLKEHKDRIAPEDNNLLSYFIV